MQFRSLRTAAAALVLAFAASAASPAAADRIVWVEFFDDGETAVEYVNPEGDHYLLFLDADGEPYQVIDLAGDPNPEGGASGLGPDIDDILEDLKRLGGAPFEITPEFWLTPLGRDLADSGIGGFTVTDPPPEFDATGLGYEHDEGFGGGGNGGFDPMGGGLKESIRQSAGRGSSNDDDDDDDDPAPIHQGEVFTGPPELVNPVPIARVSVRTVDFQPKIGVIGK